MGGKNATRRVAELSAGQGGNATYAQMLSAGLSEAQIETRIEEGWYRRRHQGVYAIGHVPRSRESRFHAAVLALGDGAVLSHRSAAAHWGLINGAVPIEVTVPTFDGRSNRDGIIVHRAPLPEAHLKVRDGIPVTSLVRTICDHAAVEPHRTPRVFDQAQVLHHFPPAPLAAEVLARRGYRGNATLRRILEGAVDPAAVRSILELRFLRLCAAHGIPRPQVNVEIGPWLVDFFWPEFGVVVETDGYTFHRTAAARRNDASRDEYLRRLGLTVVRLTWRDVTELPAATAAYVLEALRIGSSVA